MANKEAEMIWSETAPDVIDESLTIATEDRENDGNRENVDGGIAKKGRPRRGTGDLTTDELLKQIKVLEEENKKLKKGKTLQSKETARMQTTITTLNSDKLVLDQELARARSIVDEKLTLIDRLNNRVDSDEKDLSEAKATVADKQAEIDFLTAQLSDKSEEVNELMSQLIKNDESKVSQPIVATIVVDQATETVAESLVNTQWVKVLTSIRELSNDSALISRLKDSDIVVLCVGLDDIRKGTSGIKAYDLLKKVYDQIQPHTTTVIVDLPFMLDRSLNVQSNLFNFKAKNETGIEIVHPTFNKPKQDFWNQDGLTMTKAGAKAWSDAIASEVTLPTIPKPKQTTSHPGEVTAFVSVSKDAIGGIIGRKGATIRDLTTSYDVTMSIGKWAEKDKTSANEYVEKTDAVIISGKIDNVSSVIERVKELATPPAAKKLKF